MLVASTISLHEVFALLWNKLLCVWTCRLFFYLKSPQRSWKLTKDKPVLELAMEISVCPKELPPGTEQLQLRALPSSTVGWLGPGTSHWTYSTGRKEREKKNPDNLVRSISGKSSSWNVWAEVLQWNSSGISVPGGEQAGLQHSLPDIQRIPLQKMYLSGTNGTKSLWVTYLPAHTQG